MDERNNAVEAFLEALTCTPTIYSSCYDYEGTLLSSNCPDTFFHTAFERVGCLRYMLEYAKASRLPLILSAELGALWCACFAEDAIYVIGPVFNTEISMASIQEAIGRYDLTYSMRVRLQEAMKALPVVSSITFFQFGVMLHFLLTGEKLSRSDLQLQERKTGAAKKSAQSKRDRHQTWMVEQALLEHIRKGDLDYASTMARAGLLSKGVQVKTEDAVKNAILSAYGFNATADSGADAAKFTRIEDLFIRNGMENVSTLIPAAIIAVALLFLILYPMTRKTYNALMAQLKNKREGKEYTKDGLEKLV